MTQTLSQLEHHDAFIARHIGPSAPQQAHMLATVGEATTEAQELAELKAIASQNQRYKSFICMVYSAVVTPPVILRNMLENPGWYTAYTPYQTEVSQGQLEELLNFQQLTLDLTGLDISSALLLDEATAAAEAMALAKRASTLKQANRFFVADDVHPQILDVVRTPAPAPLALSWLLIRQRRRWSIPSVWRAVAAGGHHRLISRLSRADFRTQ